MSFEYFYPDYSVYFEFYVSSVYIFSWHLSEMTKNEGGEKGNEMQQRSLVGLFMVSVLTPVFLNDCC